MSHSAQAMAAALDSSIGLATPADIAGVLEIQEQNLPSRGGALSVAFSGAWFEATLLEMPVMVARKDNRIIGYVVSSPFAAQGHVPIVQAMLHAHPASPIAYLYGPICVAQSERGRGLAGRLFASLKMALPGRAAMTFIRSDNLASLKVHEKMGLRAVAKFMHDGMDHVVMVDSHKPDLRREYTPPRVDDVAG